MNRGAAGEWTATAGATTVRLRQIPLCFLPVVVYEIELATDRAGVGGTWPQAYGSRESADAFLRGAKASLVCAGAPGCFEMPDSTEHLAWRRVEVDPPA